MVNVQRLVYTESGGFAGLRRGCTLEPAALPPVPGKQLQKLITQPPPPSAVAQPDTPNTMPDNLLYTLELVTEPPDTPDAPRWVLQYPATDVPEDVEDLIGYLHEQAQPLPWE